MAKADDPSLLGFAKYLIRGGKTEEESAQAKAAKQAAQQPKAGEYQKASVVDTIKARNKALEQAGSDDGYKKGGKVKKYARGGGIEQRGKTRGTFR